MLCEGCGEREATIHEVLIKSGQKLEKHLCEQCAKGAGYDPQGEVPISELISKYILSHSGKGPVKAASPGGGTGLKCPVCGLTYAEFKQTGLLGCADCYRAFEAQLGPLLERAHEGGSHHVGKIPRRALAQCRAGGTGQIEAIVGGIQERTERLALVRRQLAEALEAEQYERAATLRDEIRRLTEITPEAEGRGQSGEET